MTSKPSIGVEGAVALIDANRLEQFIERIAEITEAGPGVTRLAYSPLERRAHDVFRNRMCELGLTVTVDAAGNSIAELPGVAEGSSDAVGTGSHLDSVPSGGRFDGIAGVAAAVEVARSVVESGLPHRRPWRFVAFAAEEGARFGQACNGSRAASGVATSAGIAGLYDNGGITMAEAMASVGLRPDRIDTAAWASEDWHGFIELHVEQGNVLETSRTPIGIVDVISGSSRVMVELVGTASHTGATPMHLRRDALVAAAECVLLCEQIAQNSQHRGTRITVGKLDVEPSSITTIPGRVIFSVDVRDIDGDRQRTTARDLLSRFQVIAKERDVDIDIQIIGDTSPAILPTRLVDLIAAQARAHGVPYRIMPSGASHDTQQISKVTSAGMIFVPSQGGLSHVPDEWTSYQELALGTQVLLRALYALDLA
ncbi:Zn-dependent hydrolase [Mycetocola miduiensis]|jgi:allantoate deiminase|uniref:Allantoate deiminase/N-carbamoyl-L-amino-acid hydrolase n=1 Tax=Mycetocola miduiensis TaxID=995034 RepID=A0A1I4Z0H2_9MICO|nr:Zn-dependent hydrolase [Mycetocola miduiensis]SFN43762.1 allantoate deiminase/N-carbamoyl-L-amino-acid hydrolase [Mycetocola miduiensis]